MSNNEITQEFLQKHFKYRKGHLFWIKPAYKPEFWEQFGCYKSGGYRHGRLRGKDYLEHRLIWLYHYGEWPNGNLDHIDGIPGDNRIKNLRECTQQQNMLNKKSLAGSTSKFKGVYWDKQMEKWVAQYRFNGKKYYVGLYECEKEAAKAYKKATKPLHKEFANYK